MQCTCTGLRLFVFLCLFQLRCVASSRGAAIPDLEPTPSNSPVFTKEGGANSTLPQVPVNSTTNSTGNQGNYTSGSSTNISHSNTIKNASEWQGLQNDSRVDNETQVLLMPTRSWRIPSTSSHTKDTMPSPTVLPSASNLELPPNTIDHTEEPPGIGSEDHNSSNSTLLVPSKQPYFCLIERASMFSQNEIGILYSKQCRASCNLLIRVAVLEITSKSQVIPESVETKVWTNWTDWAEGQVQSNLLNLVRVFNFPELSLYGPFFMEYTYNCSQRVQLYEGPIAGQFKDPRIDLVQPLATEIGFGDSLYINYTTEGNPKPKVTGHADVWKDKRQGSLEVPPNNLTHYSEQMFFFIDNVTVNQTCTFTATSYKLSNNDNKNPISILMETATVTWTITVTQKHPPMPPLSPSVSERTCDHLVSTSCFTVESTPQPTPAVGPNDPAANVIAVVLVASFVCVFLVIFFSIVTGLLCRRYQRQDQSEPVVKPCASNPGKVSLRYFNDNYYKSKYGLVGDYHLPSIARNDFAIGDCIGEGHFGTVYKATFNLDGESVVVAAKCVNLHDSADKMKDFFHEARFMGHLNHPNIIKLYGISVCQEPFYLISEYMCEGDLRQFLHRAAGSMEQHVFDAGMCETARVSTSLCDPPQLEEEQLVGICLQIARAMDYMAQHGQIHRDLAARNCLVGSNLVVKITDFGLSRSLYKKNYYRVQSGTEVPVRWLAPEALTRGEFSVDSDVWAFGVVVWEVFSFGHHPYYALSNEEIFKWLTGGNILEQPINCPDSIYAIMKDCWKWDRSHRPTFSRLVCMLLQHSLNLDQSSLPAPTPSLSQLSDQDDTDECEPAVFDHDKILQIDHPWRNFVTLGQSTEV